MASIDKSIPIRWEGEMLEETNWGLIFKEIEKEMTDIELMMFHFHPVEPYEIAHALKTAFQKTMEINNGEGSFEIKELKAILMDLVKVKARDALSEFSAFVKSTIRELIETRLSLPDCVSKTTNDLMAEFYEELPSIMELMATKLVAAEWKKDKILKSLVKKKRVIDVTKKKIEKELNDMKERGEIRLLMEELRKEERK